jgi:hypothetical protein
VNLAPSGHFFRHIDATVMFMQIVIAAGIASGAYRSLKISIRSRDDPD